MGKDVQLINSILGTAFRCSYCPKILIAGSLGLKPLAKRVLKHWVDTNPGHMEMTPINPPKGMFYTTIPMDAGDNADPVGTPFDGVDRDKWVNELRELDTKYAGIQPSWELYVEGDALLNLCFDGGLTIAEAQDVLNDDDR